MKSKNKTDLGMICWSLDDDVSLLSAHAVLSQRPQIPRVYVLKNNPFTEDMLNECLITSHETWNTLTWQTLKHTLIEPSMFDGISGEESRMCISLIEGVLYDKHGAGDVHYEMARTTPFTSEDCANFIWKFSPTTQSDLLDSLSKRMLSKQKFTSDYGNLEKQLKTIEGLSAYQASLKEKIDRHWQKFWKSENKYTPKIGGSIDGVEEND